MKYNIVLPALLVIFSISCNKETTTPTPVFKTPEQVLTERTWKADEIRVQLSNNTTQYYKRGVSGTTYDTDSLKFTMSNTGTYYFSGASYATTWNFTDAAKTKMTVVINQPPSPITIYLENIQLTESYFKYAQYYTGTISYLASCTRLPN